MSTPPNTNPYHIEPGATFPKFTTPGLDNGQIAEFCAGYIAAAFTLAEPEVVEAGRPQLAEADAAYMQRDCSQFVASAASAGLLTSEAQMNQAGADYFLTRNGHGLGFWAYPETYGEAAAETLSTLAREAGPADLYLGDDGAVYHYPPVSYLAEKAASN